MLNTFLINDKSSDICILKVPSVKEFMLTFLQSLDLFVVSCAISSVLYKKNKTVL